MLVAIETNYVVHLVLKLIIIIGIIPQFVQVIVLCCWIALLCTLNQIVRNMDHKAAIYLHPEDWIMELIQEGRPVEDYMEDFFDLCHRVPWNDNSLKSCFWSGLDNHLLVIMAIGYSSCLLQQHIDYCGWLVTP